MIRAPSKASAPNAKRKPLQQIEFDTSESDQGAWAEGKAPLALVTEFLGLVMSEDYDAAFTLSEQILKCEPDNEIMKEWLTKAKGASTKQAAETKNPYKLRIV